MARTAPISIRLDPETQSQLEQMSAATGITMSNLARMAIEAALRSYHENGQRIEVPFRFEAIKYPPSGNDPEQLVAEEPPTGRTKS